MHRGWNSGFVQRVGSFSTGAARIFVEIGEQYFLLLQCLRCYFFFILRNDLVLLDRLVGFPCWFPGSSLDWFLALFGIHGCMCIVKWNYLDDGR